MKNFKNWRILLVSYNILEGAIEESSNLHLQKDNSCKEIVFISCKRLNHGCVRLNCDGSCKENEEPASCEGRLCDYDGRWLKGFSLKIGACDALHAKMRGVYLGIDIAWRKSISPTWLTAFKIFFKHIGTHKLFILGVKTTKTQTLIFI